MRPKTMALCLGALLGCSQSGALPGAGGSGGAAGAGGSSSAGGASGSTATGGVAGTGGSGGGGVGGSGGAAGAGVASCPTPPAGPTGTSDAVAGTLITFNDNGGWSWYQDERAVVDTRANKLIIGSTASGGSRSGQNEAVIYDLASGTPTRYTLPSSLAISNVDDHNSPALLIRPDGQYLAQWSGHHVDCLSRFSVFDGTKWGPEVQVDWTSLGCPWAGATTNMVTYSNPWYLGSSIYSFVRSIATDPAALTSADDGQTFSYYGRLMDTGQAPYAGGYFKYWGNNTDRIDFVGTEAHPRDADNSLYHGYISGGKVYDSAGAVKDSSLHDSGATITNSLNIDIYTPVFKTGTSVNGMNICRLWNHDIVRYADGTIAVLGQGRADTCDSTPYGSDPDKRMLYFRFDGSSWKTTYLVKGGAKLFADEEDYIGLGALVPDDPNTIYISTPYDPTTDTMGSSGKHEIWRGTTCDNGATFTWTPVTKGSTKDNIRPVVPKWDASHTALLWMRGTYSSSQSYATQIVGTITGP